MIFPRLTLDIELYDGLPDGEGRVDHPGVLHPAGHLLPVVLGSRCDHQLGPRHIPAWSSLKQRRGSVRAWTGLGEDLLVGVLESPALRPPGEPGRGAGPRGEAGEEVLSATGERIPRTEYLHCQGSN